MEKELNLVDILKDCPKGTKLYSTIYGEVEIVEIRNNCMTKHPIIYKYKDYDGNYYVGSTTIDGKFSTFPNGECTLFPSKDQRDWSKFKVELEMVDGEFYYCCYSHNRKENSFIFIYEKHMMYKTKCYVALNPYISVLFKNDLITNNNENLTELRKATVEEKQQLLDFIKIRNYEWDADKKALIKIESKFDINTLKPFDKVLVRDGDNERWRCSIFSYIYKLSSNRDVYVCACHWNQCVPYNEDTRHLVGTKETPPKKYINW